METTINPKTLKLLRTHQNLTQEQLADRIPCSNAQVSRWERGKNLRLSTDKREKLVKALRTDWETLTRPPIDVPQDELAQAVPKEQLNIRVETSTKTALELVCLRYGVKPATVMELAPLLFLITAENSLRAREEKINAAKDQIYGAAKTTLPHIDSYVVYSTWDDIESDEKHSISKRDIFAETLKGDWGSLNVDTACPYTNYLRELASELIEGGDAVAEISPNYGTAPDYNIALDTFREVTGIDGDPERDKFLHYRIRDRYIKLHDVIDKRKELDENEFQAWLDEAFSEASEQFTSDYRSFIDRQTPENRKELLEILFEENQKREKKQEDE